MKFRRNTLAD